MFSRKQNIVFRYLVLLLISVLAALGVYAAIGLYADGSFFLYSILKSKGFFDFYKAREFSQIITQAPVVFALKLGVKDLNVLIRIHSFGLVAIPMSFWLAALALQIKTDLFWLFVTAFSVSYLGSGFFAIGEYNLAYGMTALCAALLLREKIGKFGLIALVATSFGVTLTYESMIFLGPLLFAICILRVFATKECCSTSFKVALLVSSLFFAVSCFISLCSIIFPLASVGSAVKGIGLMILSMHFGYLLLMGLLFASSYSFGNKFPVILAWLVSIIYLIDVHFWNFPLGSYRFRLLSGLLLFLIIAVSSFYFFTQNIPLVKFKWDQSKRIPIRLFVYLSQKMNAAIFKIKHSKPSSIPQLLFIALIIPFYIQVIGFYYWVNTYEYEVITRRGLVPIEDTSIAYSKYNWAWTNPSLSMVLRGNRPGAIIINCNSCTGWQPFDPATVDVKELQSFKKDTFIHHSTLVFMGRVKFLVDYVSSN